MNGSLPGQTLVDFDGRLINMSDRKSISDSPITVGWREWISLPDLDVPAVKAKFDTGARTSSLHTFLIEPYEDGGKSMIRFGVHPLQRRDDVAIICHAEVVDRRWTTDSGGGREKRYVIGTTISMAGRKWPIELNLTNREDLRFRFLVGRTTMEGMIIVDPLRSYVLGRKLGKSYPPKKA